MELIRVVDFEQPRYIFTFLNSVSGTKIPGNEGVSVVEIGEAELVLGLPPRACAAGHGVVVGVSIVRPGLKQVDHPEEIFSSTGKVTDIQVLDQGQILARIKLIQYDTESWSRFLSLILERQAEITELIESNRS